jgi:hypothetical protein
VVTKEEMEKIRFAFQKWKLSGREQQTIVAYHTIDFIMKIEE